MATVGFVLIPAQINGEEKKVVTIAITLHSQSQQHMSEYTAEGQGSHTLTSVKVNDEWNSRAPSTVTDQSPEVEQRLPHVALQAPTSVRSRGIILHRNEDVNSFP